MKNTVLANFRCFTQEYTPLDSYGNPKNWDPSNRYFYFQPFHLQLVYVPWMRFCWRVILRDSRENDKGAYLHRTCGYEYPREACFWLSSDRAALRLLRMFEGYSTAKYLQSVCRPGALEDVGWALEAEFGNMMRKVERFCHSYGGCQSTYRCIVPNQSTYNQSLFNG